MINVDITTPRERVPEIRKWLSQNITGGFDSFSTESSPGYSDIHSCFFFDNEEDALLFKLTWMGV